MTSVIKLCYGCFNRLPVKYVKADRQTIGERLLKAATEAVDGTRYRDPELCEDCKWFLPLD